MNSEYIENKNVIPWNRIFITIGIILSILLIVILFLIFKKPSMKKLNSNLIKAAEIYNQKYPIKSDCENITLEILEKNGLLKISDYKKYNIKNSYVKICKNNEYTFEIHLE